MEVTAHAPVAATFAVAWSPKWSARLNGRDVELGATDLGLLTLALPAGTHTVDLAFARDVWDGLGAALTAATLAAALVVAVRARSRGRPTGSLS